MEGMFKTAIGGFKKSDVLAFIDNQEREFAKKERDLQSRAEELNKQLAALKTEKDDAVSQAEGLKCELESEQHSGAEADKRFEAASAQIDSLRRELSHSESINNELRRELSIYKQTSVTKSAELAGREKELKELKKTVSAITTTQQRISRVMVEAQNTADKMVIDARAQAAAIVGEARDRLARILRETGELKRRAGAFAGDADNLSTLTRGLYDELSGIASELGSDVSEADASEADASEADTSDSRNGEKEAPGAEKTGATGTDKSGTDTSGADKSGTGPSGEAEAAAGGESTEQSSAESGSAEASASNGTQAQQADTRRTERTESGRPEDGQTQEAGGSMFDFSRGGRMFNWDK